MPGVTLTPLNDEAVAFSIASRIEWEIEPAIQAARQAMAEKFQQAGVTRPIPDIDITLKPPTAIGERWMVWVHVPRLISMGRAIQWPAFKPINHSQVFEWGRRHAKDLIADISGEWLDRELAKESEPEQSP